MPRFVGVVALFCAALAGCSHEDLAGVEGLAFEATAAVVPPPAQNVQVTATITNITSGPIDVHYGGCAVTPVFHTGSLNGPIVYDPRPSQACPSIALTKTLAAGESFTITGSAVPNLPAGTYYVAAVILANGTTTIGAGKVTF